MSTIEVSEKNKKLMREIQKEHDLLNYNSVIIHLLNNQSQKPLSNEKLDEIVEEMIEDVVEETTEELPEFTEAPTERTNEDYKKIRDDIDRIIREHNK